MVARAPTLDSGIRVRAGACRQVCNVVWPVMSPLCRASRAFGTRLMRALILLAAGEPRLPLGKEGPVRVDKSQIPKPKLLQ